METIYHHKEIVGARFQMKLKPFEKWVDGFIDEGYEIYNYVGIRADEPERTGFMVIDKPITSIFPFREGGIVRSDIENILQRNGLEMPCLLSMALSVWLHILFLPEKNRMV